MVARFLPALTLSAILPFASSAQTKKAPTTKEYRSQSGGVAKVLAVDKLPGFEGHESRIEFYGPNEKRTCSADYSSADGTHGFGVAEAEWTPDGRYFVFSMVNSGGHQPWHAPTNFYDSKNHMLCSLDDFLDPPGIATADFMLGAPNLITTFIYGKQDPATTRLDRIRETGTRDGRPRCLRCDAGLVHEFGDRTPYVHSPK